MEQKNSCISPSNEIPGATSSSLAIFADLETDGTSLLPCQICPRLNAQSNVIELAIYCVYVFANELYCSFGIIALKF